MDYLLYIFTMSMHPFFIYYNCPFLQNVINVRRSFFILLFIQCGVGEGKGEMVIMEMRGKVVLG
jgi:hypothetical protein